MEASQAGVRVNAVMAAVLEQHAQWIAVPSVAFPDFDPAPVHAMAEAVVASFAGIGVDAQLRDIPGGFPAVVADLPAPPGAPTVLLYAHYDVQPAPADQGWTTDPFVATTLDGRIHGRGAADDKAGIAIHLAALAAFDGKPPVGVKLVIEGDEEAGSQLEHHVAAHPDLYQADAMLVADLGNLRAGEPVLTVALRGHVRAVVTVDTLEADLHSGMFGGPAPDALTALIRLLDTLTDKHGSCAVEGLQSGEWSSSEYTEEMLRAGAGLLPGVQLVGEGSIAGRLWSKPSVSVLGIDVPSVAEGGNVLHATARAAIGLRIPAGQDPAAAAEALRSHLRDAAPWGAHVEVEIDQLAPGFSQGTDGPFFAAMSQSLRDAYGSPALTAGAGGSIPLLDALRKAAPDADFVLFGAGDVERSAMHGPNESVDVSDIERMALAEALLLQSLATST